MRVIAEGLGLGVALVVAIISALGVVSFVAGCAR